MTTLIAVLTALLILPWFAFIAVPAILAIAIPLASLFELHKSRSVKQGNIIAPATVRWTHARAAKASVTRRAA